MKKVTMSDIANELGVSTVSVSKALSGREGVSDEVRAQIKQKAEEMGYRYNSIAKSMKEGLSDNIGVLVSERFFSDNAFYSDLYQKIVREFSKLNYSCILEILSRDDEKNCVMPNMIINNKVDGLVILGQMKSKYINKLLEIGIPYIFMDFYDEHNAVDSVVSDSVYGSYLLTDYLIKKGHKKIGFVGDIYATSSILDRYIGYYKALVQNHLEINPEWVICDRDDYGDYVYMCDLENMPEAFVCNCDEAAYTFVGQLKEKGYKVPEDVSVVGFDDFIYARLCDPMLTTFKIDLDMMSEEAANAMIKKIQNRDYRIGRKVISGEIIIRDSVIDKNIEE
ncbi:MAG: LacI family DNA-binding transcriptional regulator [Lachnospiraceae bacterium]|nr:LacI family DNA-binding transcriptional regulator [Lachnospiraceae bacterium]